MGKVLSTIQMGRNMKENGKSTSNMGWESLRLKMEQLITVLSNTIEWSTDLCKELPPLIKSQRIQKGKGNQNPKKREANLWLPTE